MSPPSSLRVVTAILKKELRLELRHYDAITSGLLFSLVVMLVFQFSVGSANIAPERYLPGLLWLTIGFAAVVGLMRAVEGERSGDALIGLFRSPASRGALFLGMLAANLLRLLVLDLILLALTIVFFNFPTAAINASLVGVLLLGSIGLGILGTLFGTLVLRVQRGESLLALLVMPTATPILLASIELTANQFKTEPDPSRSWWGLLLGFNLLYFFIALATFEYALEE